MVFCREGHISCLLLQTFLSFSQLYLLLHLAEMELIFPAEAFVMLSSVVVARKVQVTHQCFSYCGAVLTQLQG